jgi:hypothetical protein
MPGGALCSQGSQWNHSGCHPNYLKTVSQQLVCRIWTHSLVTIRRVPWYKMILNGCFVVS